MNMRKDTEEWKARANEVIARDLKRRKIGITEALQASIAINILSTGEDVSAVTFQFLAYGRFVDMGVSRGWAIGSRRAAAIENNRLNSKKDEIRKPRRPKKFYSRTIFRLGHELREILLIRYGVRMIQELEANLPGDTITIDI
jgi:hypothetical protein